jgi:hypothetical protein
MSQPAAVIEEGHRQDGLIHVAELTSRVVAFFQDVAVS